MEKVEHEYRESINVAFTWKRLFLELFLIGERSILNYTFTKTIFSGFIVFIVPVLIITTEMFFSHFYMFARKGPI